MNSKQTRRLSLSRETVRVLTDDDMGRAAAARGQSNPCPTPVIHTFPINQCFVVVSLDTACIAASLNPCCL
jgi:hypothetical protein